MPTTWYEIHHWKTDGGWELVERGDVSGNGDRRLTMYQQRHPGRVFRLDVHEYGKERVSK